MKRPRRLPAAVPPGDAGSSVAEQVLADDASTLLDVVDHALTKGVVLTGDLTIALAHVDLIYVRVSLLLCAADRVLPGEDPDPLKRRHDRREARRHQGGARRTSRRNARG
jgi:hypothetical protein